MRILDLCSGTGSATAPFAAAGWEVVSVDTDAYWRPTHVADIREWAPGAGARFDVVWASPPCTYFSRRDQPGLYPNEPDPDTSIAEACVRLISELAPSVWWLENVRGARRWLAPLLGPPTTHLGPWWLWTNAIWLPVLAGRPRKRMSGYRKGTARRSVRLAVHPDVAAAVYRATLASLGATAPP